MCRWGCSEKSKVCQVIMPLNDWEPNACESILNEKVSLEWSRPADYYVHKLVFYKLVYRRPDQAYRYLKNKLLLEIKKRGIQQLIYARFALNWLPSDYLDSNLQIFKCRFCGTKYCEACGRGDFHGVMTDKTVCQVCFQVLWNWTGLFSVKEITFMHGCSTEYISVGLTKQKHKGQILLSTMAKL